MSFGDIFQKMVVLFFPVLQAVTGFPSTTFISILVIDALGFVVKAENFEHGQCQFLPD